MVGSSKASISVLHKVWLTSTPPLPAAQGQARNDAHRHADAEANGCRFGRALPNHFLGLFITFAHALRGLVIATAKRVRGLLGAFLDGVHRLLGILACGVGS